MKRIVALIAASFVLSAALQVYVERRAKAAYTDGVISVTEYAPATQVTPTIGVALWNLVDATFSGISITAPSTGNIVVRLSAYCAVADNGDPVEWRILAPGPGQLGNTVVVTRTDSGTLCHATIPITGLTPGNSYSLQWEWQLRDGGITTATMAFGDGTSTNVGPGHMIVEVAP